SMVRLTPRRIGLAPSLVATLTCRSRISRVDMVLLKGRGTSVQGGVDVDEHALAVHRHGIHGDRFGGRKAQRDAVAQVELRPVQPALEGAALDLAVSERDLLVGADVGDRVEGAVLGADDGHLDGTVLALELDADGRTRREVLRVAGELSRHSAPPASSASISAMSRSSMSGMPISWIRSAKNPRTTSKRASSSGMPRERR